MTSLCDPSKKKNILQTQIEPYDSNKYNFGIYSDNFTNFTRYLITDDPIKYAIAVPYGSMSMQIWTNLINNNPEFKQLIDELNYDRKVKLAKMYSLTMDQLENTIQNIMQQYYSINKDTINKFGLSKVKSKECLDKKDKFPIKHGYKRQVVGVDPCKIKYKPTTKDNKEFIISESSMPVIATPVNNSYQNNIFDNQSFQQNSIPTIATPVNDSYQNNIFNNQPSQQNSMPVIATPVNNSYQNNIFDNQSFQQNSIPTIATPVNDSYQNNIFNNQPSQQNSMPVIATPVNDSYQNNMSQLIATPVNDSYQNNMPQLIATPVNDDDIYMPDFNGRIVSRKECINAVPPRPGYRRQMVTKNPCRVKYVQINKKSDVLDNMIGRSLNNPIETDEECKIKYEMIKDFLNETNTHLCNNRKKSKKSSKRSSK